jgi:membrane associated rhomboid family serine protease
VSYTHGVHGVLPRFRRGAFTLFALIFLVTMLLGDRPAVAEALTLEPGAVLSGRQWWTPLTTLLRCAEGLGLLALLGSLAVQWVMGSRLEGFWGTARYLIMVVVAGLLAYASTLALAVAVPAAAQLSFAGPAPINAAAAVAFAFVFVGEKMRFGSVELSPLLLGAIAAALALVFPLVVALVAGVPIAAAWPTLIPGVVAAVVATVFVQPWKNRENSGTVGRAKPRNQPHLRVVRTPDDMLN